MRYYKKRQWDMLFWVDNFFKKEKTSLQSKVPILEEIIDDFVTTVKQIQKLILDINRKSSSVTQYKSAYKGILVDAVLKLSKVGRAYSIRQKDDELRKKLKYTRTQLTREKPGIVAERCKGIIDAVKALKALPQYGIKPEDIKMAEENYDQFTNFMFAPKKRIQEVKSKGEAINMLIEECVFNLEEQIDALVEIACENDSEKLSRYKSARKIFRDGPGRKAIAEERYREIRKRKKKS